MIGSSSSVGDAWRFLRSQTDSFLNDRVKLSQFGHNVQKYTVSFSSVLGQMTETSSAK